MTTISEIAAPRTLSEIATTRTLTNQLVDDLRAGLCVLLTGLPMSGRSHLARLVANELTRLGSNVVFVRGNWALAERSFAALSLVDASPKTQGSSSFSETTASFEAIFDNPNSVLIVDDAANLDRMSAGLIAHVRSRKKMPMLLVGGYGTFQDELLAAMVTEAQPGVAVAMTGMSFDDITLMVNALLGGDAGADVVSQIATLSGGLPGLVHAIVQLGRRNGRLVRHDGVWTATGGLYDGGLQLSLLPLVGGFDADEVASLAKLAAAGNITQTQAETLVEAGMVNKFIRHGLVCSDQVPSSTGIHVFPVALAELLRRGCETSQASTDDDQQLAIDLGRWPASLAGPEASVIAGRIRAHWRTEVNRQWNQWKDDRTIDTAVPLLYTLLSGDADDTRVAAVLSKTTDSSLCGDFAALATDYRAMWQHDLQGALSDLERQKATCPSQDQVLRGQQAHLILFCDRVPESSSMEIKANDAGSPELLIMAQAEALIAQGRIDDASRYLASLQPQTPRVTVIKRTLEALVLVLGDEPSAGVELAVKRLWDSVLALDMHSISGYAYVASLGLCMLGRFEELESIVEIVYRMDGTNIFQSRFKTGLFMLGSFVVDWEGRHEYARSLATQAKSLSTGVGPFPAMYGSHELLFDAATADKTWDVIDDLLDRGFLAAAIYLGATAVEADLRTSRAAPLIARGADSQSRVLRALMDYIVAASSRDVARFPAVVDHLRKACGPLDATKATITWALLLREAGDTDGWLKMAEAAWQESTLISRSADGLLARLVDAVGLTSREAEVARYTAEGLSASEIAAQMVLATRTIEAHLRSVYHKSGVNNHHQLGHLVRTWLQLRVVDETESK